MTPEEQQIEKYYDDMLDMFATDGWREFIKDAQESFSHLEHNARSDCDTNDKWQYRRGELSKLEYVINFESFIRKAYDMRQEDASV